MPKIALETAIKGSIDKHNIKITPDNKDQRKRI